jgi:type IV pilus assembly protein PilW
MHSRPVVRAAASGLSLVELLIAMLLGVFLSVGVVSIYLGCKQNYFYEEQAARLQENGRFAMQLLQRELAMSGFFGGVLAMDAVQPATIAIDCSESGWALAGGGPVQLVNNYDGQSVVVAPDSTAFTCLDTAVIAPLTDLLAIRRTAAEASLRRGVPANGLTPSTIEQWYLRLADDAGARWVKLRAADLLAAGNVGTPRTYWEAIARIFYIRRYSGSDPVREGIPTLCMENLAGNAMTSRCLVEGVENMQIEFGIDTDNDGIANRYKTAPLDAEMERAVTARIYLLLRSIIEIGGYRDTRTYALGQQVVAAKNDGFLRRVFSTTVYLRNRIQPLG